MPLEAMALGRPVIADNSGGPMETVIPGTNGSFVMSGRSMEKQWVS